MVNMMKPSLELKQIGITPSWSPKAKWFTQDYWKWDHPKLTQIGITPSWPKLRSTQVIPNLDHIGHTNPNGSPKLTEFGITLRWPKLSSPQVFTNWDYPKLTQIRSPQVDPNWDHPNPSGYLSWLKLGSSQVDPKWDNPKKVTQTQVGNPAWKKMGQPKLT